MRDECENGKRCMRVSAGEGIIYFVRAGCGNIFDFPRRSLGRNRVVVIALDLPSRGRHFDYQLTALLLRNDPPRQAVHTHTRTRTRASVANQ